MTRWLQSILVFLAVCPFGYWLDAGNRPASTLDGLNRLTSTAFTDGTTISNLNSRLDLVGHPGFAA